MIAKNTIPSCSCGRILDPITGECPDCDATIQPLTDALTSAVEAETVDEAAAILQASLGVTDGGIAGVCLGDLDEDNVWWHLSPALRRTRLVSYVKSEIAAFEGSV